LQEGNVRKNRSPVIPRESTLLALLWDLPQRRPAAAVAEVRRRLRAGRVRLCGILRDVQDQL
jgi:hypothetical protein